MKQQLYVFQHPKTPKYTDGRVINAHYDRTGIERCPKCSGIVSGLKWVGDQKVRINKRPLPDFLIMYGGSTTPFLISEKALNCFIKNGIKGIESYELIDRFFYKNEEVPLRYYNISLARLDIPIDHEASKIKYGELYHPEQQCELCYPKGRTKDIILSLHLKQPDDLDYDIFKTYEMCDIPLFSERFVQVCKDNNLTGILFEKTQDYDSKNRKFWSEEKLIEFFGADYI